MRRASIYEYCINARTLPSNSKLGKWPSLHQLGQSIAFYCIPTTDTTRPRSPFNQVTGPLPPIPSILRRAASASASFAPHVQMQPPSLHTVYSGNDAIPHLEVAASTLSTRMEKAFHRWCKRWTGRSLPYCELWSKPEDCCLEFSSPFTSFTYSKGKALEKTKEKTYEDLTRISLSKKRNKK